MGLTIRLTGCVALSCLALLVTVCSPCDLDGEISPISNVHSSGRSSDADDVAAARMRRDDENILWYDEISGVELFPNEEYLQFNGENWIHGPLTGDGSNWFSTPIMTIVLRLRPVQFGVHDCELFTLKTETGQKFLQFGLTSSTEFANAWVIYQPRDGGDEQHLELPIGWDRKDTKTVILDIQDMEFLTLRYVSYEGSECETAAEYRYSTENQHVPLMTDRDSRNGLTYMDFGYRCSVAYREFHFSQISRYTDNTVLSLDGAHVVNWSTDNSFLEIEIDLGEVAASDFSWIINYGSGLTSYTNFCRWVPESSTIRCCESEGPGSPAEVVVLVGVCMTEISDPTSRPILNSFLDGDLDPAPGSEIAQITPLAAMTESNITFTVEGFTLTGASIVGLGGVNTEVCEAVELASIDSVTDTTATVSLLSGVAEGVYPFCIDGTVEATVTLTKSPVISSVSTASDNDHTVTLTISGILDSNVFVYAASVDTFEIDEETACLSSSIQTETTSVSLDSSFEGFVDLSYSVAGRYVTCYERQLEDGTSGVEVFLTELCFGLTPFEESQLVTLEPGISNPYLHLSTPQDGVLSNGGSSPSSYSVALGRQPTASEVFLIRIAPQVDGETYRLPQAAVNISIALSSEGNVIMYSELLWLDPCKYDEEIQVDLSDIITQVGGLPTITIATSSADTDYNGLAVQVEFLQLQGDPVFVVAPATLAASSTVQNVLPREIFGHYLDCTEVLEQGVDCVLVLEVIERPDNDLSISIYVDEELSASGITEFEVTPENWDSKFWILKLQGVNDWEIDGNFTAPIALQASESVANGVVIYEQLIAVAVVDTNVASVNIRPDSEELTVDEGGANTQSVHVSLTSKPTQPVTVFLGTNDTTEGRVVPDTLTFTADLWNVEQSATVFGLKDSDNTETFTPFEVKATRYRSEDIHYSASQLTSTLVMYSANVVFPSVLRISPLTCPQIGCNLTLAIAHTMPTLRVSLTPTSGDEGGDAIEFLVDVTDPVYDNSDGRRLSHDENGPLGRGEFRLSLPPLHWTGYMNLTIENVGGGSTILQQAFYVSDACPHSDWFGIGLSCQPCPEGGFCPGGERVWPKPGHYVQEETIPAVAQCSEPSSRCLGTKYSLCQIGYNGDFCDECAEEYYRRAGTCLPCRTDGDTAEGAFTIIVGLCFLGYMSLSSNFLSTPVFDLEVWALGTLQLVAKIGLMAKHRLPESVQSLYRYLSIVLIDFEFIRPGCSIAKVKFWQLWLFTFLVGLVLQIPIVAGLGKFIRSLWWKYLRGRRSRSKELKQKTSFSFCGRSSHRSRNHKGYRDTTGGSNSEEEDSTGFSGVSASEGDSYGYDTESEEGRKADEEAEKRYVPKTRAILTVFTFTMSLVLTRSMQAINCAYVGDELRLVIEQSTLCYQGFHIFMALVSWAVVFAFIGATVFWFYATTVSPLKSRFIEDERVTSRIDFLYGDYEERYIAFFGFDLALEIIMSVCVAFLSGDSATQTAVVLITLSLHLAVIVWVKPMPNGLVLGIYTLSLMMGLYAALLNYVSTLESFTDETRSALEVVFFLIVLWDLLLLVAFVVKEIRALRAADKPKARDEVDANISLLRDGSSTFHLGGTDLSVSYEVGNSDVQLQVEKEGEIALLAVISKDGRVAVEGESKGPRMDEAKKRDGAETTLPYALKEVKAGRYKVVATRTLGKGDVVDEGRLVRLNKAQSATFARLWPTGISTFSNGTTYLLLTSTPGVIFPASSSSNISVSVDNGMVTYHASQKIAAGELLSREQTFTFSQ